MKIDTQSKNISTLDSYIRYTFATVLIFISVYSQCYLLMLLSMLVAFTAAKKHCFLYEIFKINEKLSLKNYYISHLPKYNPSAVFMFDKNSQISFKNESADNNFSHINTLNDFHIKELEDGTYYYEYLDKNYQLQLKVIDEINSILLYVVDITEVVELGLEMERTQKEIIYAMGEIGETRSKETGNHVKRVAKYSYELAILYGLSEDDAKKLQYASPMHDIGKVGIPDNILNKPGKLDSGEWKVMMTHASLGYDMLKSSSRPIIQAAAIVANQHHEKYDGSGYPNSLKGEEIHIYGRITAIADVFDALGSKRVYKDAWELDDIIELFKNERAKHFDPELVDLFLSNLSVFLDIRDRYQDV
jgi:putative two-component system response regulator